MGTCTVRDKSQPLLLDDLPAEIIVSIAARLPAFRLYNMVIGTPEASGNLLNLCLTTRRMAQVLSINSKLLKNKIAKFQYAAAHSLRLKTGDVTVDDLRGYYRTKWAVTIFVDKLSECLPFSSFERKDCTQICAAGLCVLDALHKCRISRKDALPARFFVEAITPEVWALVRFASLNLVKLLEYHDGSLKHKHPAWSSSVKSPNAPLAIEELLIDGGLGLMYTIISTDTFGIPLATKLMREITRRFITAVRTIPSYVDYSRQIIAPLPMPQFRFLQGFCKVRPPFSMFATSILLTHYYESLSVRLSDNRFDCMDCIKKWEADSDKADVKKYTKDIPRETAWEKYYDIDWLSVTNDKILLDQCGFWREAQTTLALTKMAAEVIKDINVMVEERYIDIKNKAILPPGAPITKEFLIMSLNHTVEKCGDPGNPLAGMEHPIWGGVSSQGHDTVSSMSLTELRDALTIRGN